MRILLLDSQTLLALLTEGNTRSNRIVGEVMPDILNDETLLRVLIDGCLSDNPYLRLRCADALERVSAQKSEWLQPYQKIVLEKMTRIQQQEVQWHLAEILPRLNLSEEDSKTAFAYLLESFKQTNSRIVMALSLEAMVLFGRKLPEHFAYDANRLLEQSLYSPIPALSARARKLHKFSKKKKNLPDPFKRK